MTMKTDNAAEKISYCGVCGVKIKGSCNMWVINKKSKPICNSCYQKTQEITDNTKDLHLFEQGRW